MLVGLIRHGLTDWNVIGKIQGQSDIPLNDEGRRQAHRLADRLATENEYTWDFVVTSDLSRARETGEIIAKKLNIPLYEPDSRLRERGFGEAEGLTAMERETRWGKEWDILDLGQEKDEAIRLRGLDFLKDIGEQYADKHVLVVSHGALLAQLYIALYKEKYTERIGNLSLTVLEKLQNNWDMKLYNCTRHLTEILDNSK
ncbi:Phosphoserine phosphatase 1 [compost metagenome]